MSFRDDDRAVTVQIGAVLLLGVLVILLSIYQVSVVPDQNKRAEFAHNQDAIADLQEVRNGVVEAATAGSARPVSMTLGTLYPARTVFVNPPPPVGTLRATEPRALTLSNARAARPETGDFLDGSDVEYRTARLEYEPGYHVYADAPTTVYENTVVYDRFPGRANLTRTGQSLVDGRRVNLVILRGELSENGLEATVDPRAASAATRTVPVTGDGGSLSIRVPSSLPASAWERLLEDEIDGTGDPTNDRYVESVAPAGAGDPGVVITLEPGATYELRTALVGVGTGAATPPAAYITDVEGTRATAAAGTTVALTAEVRDRYNNPVSGVPVSASASAGTVAASPPPTDAEGRTTVRYRKSTAGSATVTLQIDDGSAPAEAVTFEVEVVEAGGGSGAGNASALYDVAWNTSALDARDGVSYAAANDTLYVNRTVASSALRMPATAVDADGGGPVEGVDLDFATNDSAVAAFAGGNGTSDAGGEADAEVALANGTATVYVSSGGGGGDRLALRVVSAPGGASGSGDAWQDTNGNGVQDSDEGVDVSDGQFDNESVDLHMESGYGDINATTIDFNAKNVYIQPNLTATANGNGEKITIRSPGKVVIDGATFETTGSNADVNVSGDVAVSARGTSIRTQNQGDIRLVSEGDVDATDANLDAGSKGSVDLDAGGSVVADGAFLDASDKGSVAATAGGDIVIRNAEVNADDAVTYAAGGSIDDSGTTYGDATP